MKRTTMYKLMGTFKRISLAELMALLEERRQAAETAEDWDLETEAYSLYQELQLQINDLRYKDTSKVTLVTGGKMDDMLNEVCKIKGMVPMQIWFKLSHCCVIEPNGLGSLHVIIDNKLCPTSP